MCISSKLLGRVGAYHSQDRAEVIRKHRRDTHNMELTMAFDEALPAVLAGVAVMGISLSGAILLTWALTGRLD